MKVLYYTACSLFYPGFQITLNQVLEDVKKGNEVYWAYCGKAISRCCFEKCHSIQCAFCQYSYKKIEKKMHEKVHFISIGKKVAKDISVQGFRNYDEVKKFQYEGVNVGYSILSYYITGTRNNDGENIPDNLSELMKQLIPELCGLIQQAKETVYRIKPDVIKIYNGRLFDNRFMYDLAMQTGIDFTSIEVAGGYGEPFYPLKYEGGLPHSVKLFTDMTFSTWEKSTQTEEEKIQKGSDFFVRRRGGLPTGDKNIYVKNQKQGLLPESFDEKRYNIVIFNSSADEIAALGGDWEEATRLFKTQFDACEYILENSPSDIQFYLRIHPNLAKVTYSYHTDLYKLEERYPNIKVIPPTSEISSYSLLDVADKVVVFGSTMGVEACFWGKPVILIGMSYYRYLDVCYWVESKEDLISAIQDKTMQPGNKTNAIKYAYFLMDREFSVAEEKNVEINLPSITIGGRKIPVDGFFSFLGSSKLYALLRYLSIHI